MIERGKERDHREGRWGRSHDAVLQMQWVTCVDLEMAGNSGNVMQFGQFSGLRFDRQESASSMDLKNVSVLQCELSGRLAKNPRNDRLKTGKWSKTQLQ